jgi:hypothetical protein
MPKYSNDNFYMNQNTLLFIQKHKENIGNDSLEKLTKFPSVLKNKIFSTFKFSVFYFFLQNNKYKINIAPIY